MYQGNKGSRIRSLTLGLAVLFVVASALVATQAQEAQGEDEVSSPALNYVGKVWVTPRQGEPDTLVELQGTGFPAGTEFEILWQKFQGSWKVESGEFYGREYTQELEEIAKVRSSAAGELEAKFTVPEGFGFIHDVIVAQNGEILNKAAFEVEMQASIFPGSGPVGTPITLELKGVGWRPLENSWLLLYDNKFTGWLSAVTTNGVARTIIPATGGPGKHILHILHGAFTFPYMNMQQSPQPDRPTFTLEFTITDGPPILPLPAQEQGFSEEPALAIAAVGKPVIWSDPRGGPAGTPITIHGEGFPTNTSVQVLWYRVVGSRVSGQGWTEEGDSPGAVKVAQNGRFQYSFPAPDDLGGAHRVEAQIDGKVVTETEFILTPSAFSIEPTSGPVGTVATIHLKGVGWTETANIYTVVYDNGYLGYSCGFNSQGDVTIYLPMTGGPGWHFLDLYPAIYKGEDIKGVNNFRIPQLTYAEDHPGEKLPAFRFAFEVTE